MRTFKNKNFKKRDYECTNVVFCQGDKNPDPEIWEESNEIEINKTGCTPLFRKGDCIYFGYL